MEKRPKDHGNHVKMPVRQRAKQFMPFQAVSGLEEALHAKELEWKRKYGEGSTDDRSKEYGSSECEIAGDGTESNRI